MQYKNSMKPKKKLLTHSGCKFVIFYLWNNMEGGGRECNYLSTPQPRKYIVNGQLNASVSFISAKRTQFSLNRRLAGCHVWKFWICRDSNRGSYLYQLRYPASNVQYYCIVQCMAPMVVRSRICKKKKNRVIWFVGLERIGDVISNEMSFMSSYVIRTYLVETHSDIMTVRLVLCEYISCGGGN
jgi:hypothetical protein